MKTIAKIGAIVLGIGIFLWGIGLVLGGRPLTTGEIPGFYALERVMAHWDARWNWRHDRDWDWDWDRGDTYEHGAVTDFAAEGESTDGSFPTNTGMTDDEIDAVRRIELELGEGNFYLREANDESGAKPFTIEGGYFDWYSAGISGDKWEVSLRGDRRNPDEPIVIYLPPATQFSNIEIQLGAGALTADALTADRFELSVGAGGAQIDYLSSTKIDVEVGAGGASITLPQAWDSCGYEAEAGMGAITVNGETLLGGIGKVKRAGTPFLDLKAGMGGIEILTME